MVLVLGVISMHFSGFSLGQCTEWVYLFVVIKSSNTFWDIPDFFFFFFFWVGGEQ